MSLSLLTCGPSGSPCEANATLDLLSGSIEAFSSKSLSFLINNFDSDAKYYGSFCSRVVLENSCAAIVGRLDPFRILYLASHQGQNNYDYGRPSKSGFRWTGDVIPEDKGPIEIWGYDHDITKVSRALFSKYADHLYWRPALVKTLDAIDTADGHIFEALMQRTPDDFVGFNKGLAGKLYSILSKGVHWDFFRTSVITDESTLKDATRDCLLLLAGLGLVSHFVPSAYRTLSAVEAIEAYKTFRVSLP